MEDSPRGYGSTLLMCRGSLLHGFESRIFRVNTNECDHDWRFSRTNPSAMKCFECSLWRDLAPQHHLYRLATAWDGCAYKVDAAIGDMVWEAWRKRVRLTSSCQGGCWTPEGPSRAVFQFNAEDINKMRDLFASVEDVVWSTPESNPIFSLAMPAPERCPMWEVEEIHGSKSTSLTYAAGVQFNQQEQQNPNG